jgi:hypothetical protein
MKILNSQSKIVTKSHSQYGQYIIAKEFLNPAVLSCLRRDLLAFFLEGDRFRPDVPRTRVEIGSTEWKCLLGVSPSWKKFSKQLHKKSFLDWWVGQLSSTAVSLYPQLEVDKFVVQQENISVFSQLTKRLGINGKKYRLTLEGDVSLAVAGYEVGPHHDGERKRVVGLLYLGSKSGTSVNCGGELLLLGRSDPSAPYQKFRRMEEKVDDRFVEIERVEPAENTFCTFVNSQRALHAVTRYEPPEGDGRLFFYFSLCEENKHLR